MCTVLLEPETLRAEKRSREDSQKAVDSLMEYERRLAASRSGEAQGSGPVSPPYFDGPGNPFFGGRDSSGRIYVWLDNCCYGNSDKKGFYYVRYQLSMLSGMSTAYAHPALIVQKNKLRPDQVEYMERKCRETFEAARSAAGQ